MIIHRTFLLFSQKESNLVFFFLLVVLLGFPFLKDLSMGIPHFHRKTLQIEHADDHPYETALHDEEQHFTFH